MADRTAARRVKKYREIQRENRGIRRVEVQVPSVAAKDVKGLGRRLQDAFRKAAAAERPIRSVLATVNAPRPYPISAGELVHCLVTDHPDPKWRPHVEAFFDEVSAEAIHDIVLAGVVSFEDLYRAARNWRATDGRNVGWINEMADLRLARPAA
ncbi:MAG: hypothetical protein GEU28_13345 [Dehalococcoidia bacterium]|nr:hypothetical protein [Dehalococcoidia bacterium]